METVNYCIIAGISIMFLGGCLAHLSENDVFTTGTIRKFRRLIIVVMFIVTIDCVFALLEGSDISTIVLFLIKSLELIANPVLAFLVFDIFYDKKNVAKKQAMNKIRKLFIAAIISVVLLQFTAVFGLHVFYIDANNYYRRGPLMVFYIVILIVMIIALVTEMLTFSAQTQSIMNATLISFTITLVAGILLRAFYPNTNYDFLCISIAIPFLLIYYSHVTLRIDPLTKLLNRQVYSRIIERINYTTIAIVIDVNDLKQINDSYGHECGDQILKLVAQNIYRAYGKYAYCFRTGGDEFCAILKPNAFDKLIMETPYRDIYSMAEKFMERLDEQIDMQLEANKDDNFLEYGVSQGYGIYYAQCSHTDIKDKMPIEKVIELADKRMYYNKNASKNRNADSEGDSGRTNDRVIVMYEAASPKLQEKTIRFGN